MKRLLGQLYLPHRLHSLLAGLLLFQQLLFARDIATTDGLGPTRH